MKSIFKTFILATVISVAGVSAQADDAVKVDLNQIEVDMAMNPAKFNELYDRFVATDTTLTAPEMAYLYLGQGLSPQYDPYQAWPLISKAFDSQDYATAAALSEAAIDENPLSLDLLVMGLVSATRSGNIDMAIKLHHRFDMIINGIVATGTGTTASQPFYVASTADLRQFVHNVLGIQEILDTTTVGNGDVEAWKVRFPDSDREHILYFNNSLEHRYDASHRK